MSLRDFKSATDRRNFLEKKLKIDLKNISQSFFTDENTAGSIENLIGSAHIPLGVAGPLKLRTTNFELRTHYIPLATTEGALLASVSRGCKAVTESGGVEVFVENVGITRGPVFTGKTLRDCINGKNWLAENFKDIAKITESTSHHLKLKKIEPIVIGKNLFTRFYFDSQDAMGMNMATIALQQVIGFIEKNTKLECVSIAGNYDIDKKPAWLNFINGRGKRVWAEAIIKRKIVKEILKTTPEEISEVVYRKCQLGSLAAGAIGFNAHYANIISSLFIATGQDPSQVVEASLGVTTAEVTKKGDLQFSIYMPSLLVGTVGGGTKLPTQRESLQILGVSSVLEYSQVVAAAVLAGELSLIASLSENSLAKAHQKLGRKK